MAISSIFDNSGGTRTSSSSFSKSFNRSNSRSRAQSGQAYTPQQQSFLNRILPQYEQLLGGVNPQQPFDQRLGAVGGAPTPFPDVPIVQSFSPEQIGARTNQIFSGSQERVAGQQLDQTRNAAGRGYASSSPVLAALNQQTAGQGYRTASEQATNFQLGAAEQNAGLEMQSWLARIGSAQAQSNDEVRRRQLALQQQGYDVQQQNAILNALNINLRPLTSSVSDTTSSGRGGSQAGSVYSSVSG